MFRRLAVLATTLALGAIGAPAAMASVTQSIPQTNLAAGSQTFNFASTQQPWNQAIVTINRTGTGSHPWLNSLTSADSLSIDIQYSIDGTHWTDCGTNTVLGGTYVTKGVTLAGEEFAVSPVGGGAFPTGTLFRVVTTETVTTTISGTVVYDTET